MKNEDIFRKYVFEVMKMWITLLAAVMIMAAYFLILYGGVGFVQDKRFFSSAPKENLAAIPDTKERFQGAHIIGWLIIAVALLTFLGAAALAIGDGIKNDFGFLQFFVRFLVMLYLMEVYDIFFFDWVLLCHSISFPPLLSGAERHRRAAYVRIQQEKPYHPLYRVHSCLCLGCMDMHAF